MLIALSWSCKMIPFLFPPAYSTRNNTKRQLGSKVYRKTQFWKEIFICSLFSKAKCGLWSFMWSHTNLDVTLGGQVVDLWRLRLVDDLHQTHAVCQIAIVQLHVCQGEPKHVLNREINSLACVWRLIWTGFTSAFSALVRQNMLLCSVTVQTFKKGIISLEKRGFAGVN